MDTELLKNLARIARAVTNMPDFDGDDIDLDMDLPDGDDVLDDSFDDTDWGDSGDKLNDLESDVEGMDRSEQGHEITFGAKMCPTRHGCKGATNCNYDLASYPG